MAYRNTVLSPLNSITLVPTTNNDIFIGKDWLSERLPFQVYDRETRRAQLVNLADPITFQIHSTADYNDVSVVLFDCKGIQLFEITSTYGTGTQPVLKFYDPQGNLVPHSTNQYNFRLNEYLPNDTDDFFYIQAECRYDLTTKVTFISEPLYVKLEHEDTELLEYQCTENRLETIFEQFNTGFARRFPFQILDIDTESEDSDFVLQNQQLIKVTSYPYLTHTFRFKKITDYELDALNFIKSCDKFRVNTQVFVSSEQIEKERSGNDPLYDATLVVRDGDIMQRMSFPASETINVIVEPVYPFVTFSVIMDDGYNPILISEKEKFESLADLEDLRDYLNNVIIPQQGLKGEFDIDSGILRYLNGIGETYQVSEYITANRNFATEFTTTQNNRAMKVQLREFYVLIDFGDGSPYYVNNFAIYPTYQTVTHNYQLADVYTVTIWYTNNRVGGFPSEGTGIILPVQAADVELTDWSHIGQMNKMKQFNVLDGDLTGKTMSCEFLLGSYQTLEQLSIVQAKLEDIDSGSISPTGALRWLKLTSVQFTRNILNQTNVDNILISMVNNLTLSLKGYVGTKFQTPAAPPSNPTGLGRKNTLINAGWTVDTD